MSEPIVVRLAERRDYNALQDRAQAMGYSVDARKIDVAVARPFEVRVHGVSAGQATALTEGMDAEIVGG